MIFIKLFKFIREALAESFFVLCSRYNALTNSYEDLLASGVIDPLKVVLTSLETAFSLAGTVLKAGALVFLPQSNPAAAKPSQPRR